MTSDSSGGGIGGPVGDILIYPEAEAYVTSFSKEPFTIKDIGSPKWLQYHEYVEKLSQQAVLSATTKQNEFVMELLVEHEKLGVLIADVISVELWRDKVFHAYIARMEKSQFNPKSTLPLYMTLYHEACVMNLLETVLYHSDAMECAAESGGLLDLADYCQRQLVFLSTCSSASSSSEILDSLFDAKLSSQGESESDLEYLSRQATKIRFEAALKCISVVRYFTDYLNTLPISVVTRLFKTNDMPLLLVELVQSSPWMKRDAKSGKILKLIDQKWEVIPPSDIHKLTNIEGQIWLSLYQFVFNPETNRKYEMTNHSKEQFAKLISHLNDIVIDQIPALGQLKEFLLRMQMQNFPDQLSSQPIIEQLPEIRDRMESANSGKWASIAKYQVTHYFTPSENDLKKMASNFASLYDSEALDVILPGVPKCFLCGQDATKRCSKCKIIWYCSRECQVSDWKEHKTKCASMAK